MSLSRSALKFLARLHKELPFADPVPTFGRQRVVATLNEVKALLRQEGLNWNGIEPSCKATNVPNACLKNATSDIAFFELLGLEGGRSTSCPTR